MNIRHMGAEWLHSDRRTNMELSRFANWNAPNNMATDRTDLPSELSAYTRPEMCDVTTTVLFIAISYSNALIRCNAVFSVP